MDEITKFRHSSDKLMEFLNNWAKPLDERCENNNASSQQKASYYIWIRYSMLIKTIKQICAVEFFPDLCIIGRCCLEFSVFLQAVLSDKQAADDYIEFEKHAKSNYLRLFGDMSNTQKTTEFEKHIKEFGVENPNNYKWNKWCAKQGGYARLIEKYKGTNERKLYSFFSDFAHGSIIAIRILQNQQPSTSLLIKTIKLVSSDYILSTKSFLEEAWGPIVTEDSQKCKNEFNQLAQMFC